MKKCKHCQTEIDSKAKICPNCKKKQGLPVWIIILIVIIIIPIISSLGGSDESKSSENEKVETTKAESLTLEDGYAGSLDEYGFSYYIEGYVKNNTDRDYEYVSIEFTTYDAEGNVLGTCYENNSGLEAQGRWKFKAICLEETENIASFKLKEISGY